MEVSSDKSRKRAFSSPQREALTAIYNRLGGAGWTRNNNWLTNVDLTQWSGITCDTAHHVTALEISQNNVQGRLDDPIVVDALIQLGPWLEQLWLSENGLTGNLPAPLADVSLFPRLTILDVGTNQLRGSLHPTFARVSHLSWFDTTNNELTSYFRYTRSSTIKDHDALSELGNDTFCSTSASSPLPNVHVITSLLNEQQAQKLVELAILYAENNGGWQTNRHKAYLTTDIDVAVAGGDLLSTCNSHLKLRILPALSRLFHFPLSDLAMEDLFIAKYSALPDQQSALSPHRDGSELSFVITLNNPSTLFTGGGTKFMDANIIVAPKTAGTGVCFAGHLLHSGVEVISGSRYILAGFVRVYPSTPEGVSRLENLKL